MKTGKVNSSKLKELEKNATIRRFESGIQNKKRKVAPGKQKQKSESSEKKPLNRKKIFQSFFSLLFDPGGRLPPPQKVASTLRPLLQSNRTRVEGTKSKIK
ncbi:hypothetical protein KBB06_02395 [Candidatus Gracilibacteria bacterium]|nr:hypothetical protein [Candidatus Gracilibacteria bacterium]